MLGAAVEVGVRLDGCQKLRHIGDIDGAVRYELGEVVALLATSMPKLKCCGLIRPMRRSEMKRIDGDGHGDVELRDGVVFSCGERGNARKPARAVVVLGVEALALEAVKASMKPRAAGVGLLSRVQAIS